jgi:hypothetical protein
MGLVLQASDGTKTKPPPAGGVAGAHSTRSGRKWPCSTASAPWRNQIEWLPRNGRFNVPTLHPPDLSVARAEIARERAAAAKPAKDTAAEIKAIIPGTRSPNTR